MTSPFGNDPFDDDFFKQPFGGSSFGNSDIERSAKRTIKVAGCLTVFYVILIFGILAGLAALIWKLVIV